MRIKFIVATLLPIVILSTLAPTNTWLWGIVIILAIIFFIGLWDMIQVKQTLRRNYPFVAWGRYFMEDLRPKIYQYFIESDTDGRPIDRLMRSMVYQRAKKDLDSVPFGTQLDVYKEGYEWINHSLTPRPLHQKYSERVLIGGSSCSKNYSASMLNISAMSYGSLSKHAVLALNQAAKIGTFAHNTGEGGLSPHHLEPGGDLVWQIGTGYFGCRTPDGKFDPKKFESSAKHENVKMIEIKLSQGAKPGHGGLLPAKKNTPEIAKIRGVEPYTTVESPPYHSAFRTPREMMEFIKELRELSGGKPVGFKLCIGAKSEFLSLCYAMHHMKITPDFITVDGGEGGTGAAPLEFTNNIGMPLLDGLSFVHDALVGFGLRKEIKIIAAGKIISAFHVARAMAIGADICNSARGMMLALGCIQSLLCNKNTCPTGIATQDKHLQTGLDVPSKAERVANYHKETVDTVQDLLSAANVASPTEISRKHINRRISITEIRRYDEIYPEMVPNALLFHDRWPVEWEKNMQEAEEMSEFSLTEV